LRFHAVYWPGILLSAGLRLPTSIRAHGFITSNGKKLGKSLGNAVDPQALVARYGVDAVRYYLLAHLHPSKNRDFREDLLRAAYSAELAGKLGNLLQRVRALCVQNGVCITPAEPASKLEPSLARVAEQAHAKVREAVAQFDLQEALRAIFEVVAAANRYASSALQRSLASLLAALRATADLLEPFLPSTARSLKARLVPYPSLGEPLFPALRDS
jgi:methionyl-tRNA synthetase